MCIRDRSYTAEVPVLMYHHIDQEGNDSTAMTPALFEAQIAALAQAGYTAVFTDDLAAYVNQGKEMCIRDSLYPGRQRRRRAGQY